MLGITILRSSGLNITYYQAYLAAGISRVVRYHEFVIFKVVNKHAIIIVI